VQMDGHPGWKHNAPYSLTSGVKGHDTKYDFECLCQCNIHKGHMRLTNSDCDIGPGTSSSIGSSTHIIASIAFYKVVNTEKF
jgi:hypothetical protein